MVKKTPPKAPAKKASEGSKSKAAKPVQSTKSAVTAKGSAVAKSAAVKAPVTKAVASKPSASKPAAAKGASPKPAPAKAAPAKPVPTPKTPPNKKSAVAPVPAPKAAAKPVARPVSPAPPTKVVAPAKKAEPAAKVAATSRLAPAGRPAPAPAAVGNQITILPRPAGAPKGKILSRDFMIELGQAIRTAILPHVHEARGREIVGTAVSGDATFEIDRVAERALLAFLKNARAPVAYYSEDSGYTTFSNTQPQNLLIIDPIDGTRAAKSGFESCVISIASTRVIERPAMSDIDNGCVVEIVADRIFYAERGRGVRIMQGDHVKRPKLSKNTTLETVAWTMTVPARPAELIFPTAARLIDLSSLKGGFFACNSTSFSLTRLVTNQLDACVDFANRFYRDVPELVRDYFINAGRGTVVSIAPYDMAAALLIATEAGCVVTDAYGKSFDDVLLLDTTIENQRSIIAAANPELHDKLLKFFDTRIIQFEHLLQRRKDRAASS